METKTVIFKKKNRQRLDEFLTEISKSYSRSLMKKMIEEGMVFVNDEIVKKAGLLLNQGDKIKYSINLVYHPKLIPEKIKLDVLYEDSDILVIDKPAGIVVHPGAGHWKGTLVAGLLNYFEKVPEGLDPLRPGLVHRLDKDTSGVMVVAKNYKVLLYLSDLFKKRKIEKKYLALVYGVVPKLEGEIKTLIGRHPKRLKKMAVLEKRGREALTHYKVKAVYTNPNDPIQKYSLLIVTPKTGRTHQIRVHMKLLEHPVVGDSIYAGRKLAKKYLKAERQLLHAYSLRFIDMNGKSRKFITPLPDDFRSYLEKLKKIK